MSSNVALLDDYKVKILLVDDQPAKLLSYEAILEGIGETLITASCANETFDHLLKNDVALILIDVCMPDLDGFELAGMIREHPRFQQIAIIFVSAVMKADLHQLRGYELGAVDFVPVPVVPDLLRAKVKVFVDLYRKTRQLQRCNVELEQRVLERTADLRQFHEDLEKRVEERTREREAVLALLYQAQKTDSIGQLTGGVAHDFNNLLMAVMGSLTLLKKRLPEDQQYRRLLDNAIQAAQRGSLLTGRLLAYSRRQDLNSESVDVGKLVSGMETLLHGALRPGIELECQFSSPLPPALVDANQLELALLNLALNARDAMPGGGRLTISALVETENSACELTLPSGEYVHIKITDTGVGMDEVTRSRATDPFFSTKTPGQGNGLGLSVVHGIIVQSGGVLRIDSAPNVGTSVGIWLPRADIDRSASSATLALAPASMSRKSSTNAD